MAEPSNAVYSRAYQSPTSKVSHGQFSARPFSPRKPWAFIRFCMHTTPNSRPIGIQVATACATARRIYKAWHSGCKYCKIFVL